MKRRYSDIIKLIRDHKNDNDILELLSNYHENDIADIISLLTTEERKKIYKLFRRLLKYLRILKNRKSIWMKFL